MTDGTEESTRRFERIVAQHGEALARLAAVYAPDSEAQADLVQEILLAVWRGLPAFRGECTERTYVFRIGHNRGLTYRSRWRSEARLEELPELADPRPGPDAVLSASLEKQRLMSAVRQLNAAVRQAVVLHLEGLTHREIADVLGISENNVAVRLNRGRSALRALLEPEASRR